MAIVDEALRASPASSELWLFKASQYAAAGNFGEEMMKSLRNSYRTAPREGWIASQRVLLGLRLFPALAPDLQASVSADLRLVLDYPQLSQPLVNAYATDSSLRAAAFAPLHALPTDALQHFVSLVRAAVHEH